MKWLRRNYLYVNIWIVQAWMQCNGWIWDHHRHRLLPEPLESIGGIYLGINGMIALVWFFSTAAESPPIELHELRPTVQRLKTLLIVIGITAAVVLSDMVLFYCIDYYYRNQTSWPGD